MDQCSFRAMKLSGEFSVFVRREIHPNNSLASLGARQAPGQRMRKLTASRSEGRLRCRKSATGCARKRSELILCRAMYLCCYGTSYPNKRIDFGKRYATLRR